jgi:GNAT superfamily N-acetyltransferase
MSEEWVPVAEPGLEAQHSWESQVVQYPPTGAPGIGYFAGELPGDALPVDCLLWRDETGVVRGILNHYPQDYELQKRGSLNLWVDPSYFGRGVATALVLESRERWPGIDPKAQRYTAAGAAFERALLERHPRESPHTPN